MPDKSALESYIVSFESSSDTYNELPDYNLLVGTDVPLDVSKINFDDIASNFGAYIKAINGKNKSFYNKEFLRFEQLHENRILTPLVNIIAFSTKNFIGVVIDIGAMLEKDGNDDIRLKLLTYNLQAISTLSERKVITHNSKAFELMIFIAMLVNTHLYGDTTFETRAMSKIITSTIKSDALETVASIRKKGMQERSSFSLLYCQIVMLLIEFPFKNHQK